MGHNPGVKQENWIIFPLYLSPPGSVSPACHYLPSAGSQRLPSPAPVLPGGSALHLSSCPLCVTFFSNPTGPMGSKAQGPTV